LSQLHLAEGIGRTGSDRCAESERVEAAAETSFELAAYREVGVQPACEKRERCSVEERYPRSGGQFGGEAGASSGLLSRDRPNSHRPGSSFC
jgi:hypothetical protein